MNLILTITPEIYKSISTGIISAIITAIGVYLNERSKRKVLIKDNKRLVQEAELIRSDFAKQLEELKRDHQLDLQKRKYRYESKSKAYSNFFSKVDDMNTEINIKSADKMQVYITEYTRNLMRASTDNQQLKTTLTYQKRTQTLMTDATRGLVKLKHETNEIRLHASNDVIECLDLLEHGYSKLIDDSNQLLSVIPQIVLSQSQELVQAMQAPVLERAEQVELIKSTLIKQMRKELEEI